MTNRRSLITACVTATLGLAGCLGQTGSTGSDTVSTSETSRTQSRTSEEPTTSTTTEREPTTTESTTTMPEWNRTSYPVAFQWDLPRYALDDDDFQVVLLTTDDWRNNVNESALSSESESFLSETDFESETVVALQMSVSAGYNRLILHSVEGVGTSTIGLAVEEWESGSGLNNAPTHLLLVRIPNQGTEPTDAKLVPPETTTTDG